MAITSPARTPRPFLKVTELPWLPNFTRVGHIKYVFRTVMEHGHVVGRPKVGTMCTIPSINAVMKQIGIMITVN